MKEATISTPSKPAYLDNLKLAMSHFSIKKIDFAKSLKNIGISVLSMLIFLFD